MEANGLDGQNNGTNGVDFAGFCAQFENDDDVELARVVERRASGQIKGRARVVIIGAGLAGLAAAQRLSEAGLEDVLLLEAQPRPGGRVHTIRHGRFLLELGAQWLHGAQDNPLHGWLAAQNPQMLDDFEEASGAFAGAFLSDARGRGGGGLLAPALVARVLQILNASKLALTRAGEMGAARAKSAKSASELVDANNNNEWTSGDKQQELLSAGELFRRHLEAEMANDAELAEQRPLVEAIFRWFLRHETIENCCDSMQEVSLASYTDWNDSGEGALLNFRRGYASLLSWFLARFPASDWLHLNTQVLNVELLNVECSRTINDGGPILIKYKTTNKEERTLECAHVIVTNSLGFLQRNLASFFTPPLPEERRQLIQALGFGTVNKIILEFSAPFWQATSIKLVWASGGEGDEGDDEGGQPDGLPGWTRDILSFDVARKQPNLLIGWIGGQGARRMERESDAAVGAACLRVLARFLPNWNELSGTIKLLGCRCSRWHSNQFTCGSYSFRSLASTRHDLNQLHEPICAPDEQRAGGLSAPRIQFAGEATAGRHYSTTHGAILSGWREAERLLEHLGSPALVGDKAFG